MITKTTKLSKELRKLRIDYDMTQEDMARKLDMSLADLVEIESGQVSISMDNHAKLLREFAPDPDSHNSGFDSDAKEYEYAHIVRDNIQDAILNSIEFVSFEMDRLTDSERQDVMYVRNSIIDRINRNYND